MAAYKNLGAYLRHKRMEAGYSQVDLGKILGYGSSQFVSNWERGVAAPPEQGLQKLIKLLKLNRETLVHSMVLDYKTEVEERIYKKPAKTAKQSS